MIMKFHNLFEKDIHREIETVIKAEDDRFISNEITEYVITKDIQKKLKPLFSEYNKGASKNGVWISGFFGSGKSHLLKILSFVLKNMEHDGYKVGDLFAEKIEDDEILKADILKAVKQEADSLIFNIDKQSDTHARNSDDPLVSIFYKVFYDHLGLYGHIRHLAQFEYWLYKSDEFEKFKKEFREFSGDDWEDKRNDYWDPEINEYITQALSKVKGRPAQEYSDIIEVQEKDLNLSIDQFGQLINDHLDRKGPNARMNIFIDEVGQYISDNVKLMLNLQTIAETLAEATNNRVWVFATAQEDIEAVVGDNTAINQDEFARIQGRFSIRVPLTRSNVDEVVSIRLLKKDEKGEELLSQVWREKHASLETMLSFSGEGIQFRTDFSENRFTNIFPFVSYQFDLFQQSIMTLSDHAAFQGKAQSVGERSMLGVFQHVLKSIDEKEKPVKNTLVPFDQLFDGIRTSLRGNIQRQIYLAEDNKEDNQFAIRVLKALLLVKYYNQFKADLHNLSVLLIDDMEVDLDKLRERLQIALNELEQEVYIQRNGNYYEFLTDKEKDIQEEIRQTTVDNARVQEVLGSMIFEEVINSNKITAGPLNVSYSYTKKVDGTSIGRESELGIEILTPLHDKYDEDNFASRASMINQENMLIRLDDRMSLIDDVRMFLKSRLYINQKRGQGGIDVEVEKILRIQESLNEERRRNIVSSLRELVGHSQFYCNGTLLEITPGNDGKAKVVEGFNQLVSKVYSSLSYVSNIPSTEEGVRQAMSADADDLFKDNESGLKDAERQVYQYVKLLNNQNQRLPLTDLKNQFTSKPYGWPEMSLWAVLVRLYKKAMVEPLENGAYLNSEEFLECILNTRHHPTTILQPQAKIEQTDVNRIKEFYNNLFDVGCSYSEPKEIANSFFDKLDQLISKVENLKTLKSSIPFLEKLDDFHDDLRELKRLNRNDLFDQGLKNEDAVLNFKVDHWEPIQSFMHGSQKEIYDKVMQTLNSDATNLKYVSEDLMDKLTALKEDDTPYRGDIVRNAKEAHDQIKTKIKEQLEKYRLDARRRIEVNLNQLQQETLDSEIPENEKEQLFKPFKNLNDQIEKERYIANLKEYSDRADSLLVQQLNLLPEIQAKLNEKESRVASEPKPEYIQLSNMPISNKKRVLKTREEVEEYTEELRQELYKQIDLNRRIHI